jgi:hypothetical protein
LKINNLNWYRFEKIVAYRFQKSGQLSAIHFLSPFNFVPKFNIIHPLTSFFVMIHLIITLPIALGSITFAQEWEQLMPTQQQTLIEGVIIDDMNNGYAPPANTPPPQNNLITNNLNQKKLVSPLHMASDTKGSK